MGMTLTTWRSDGRPVITALGKGGVFVETIIRTQGEGSTYISYPSLRGRSLRIFEAHAGSFTWNVGVDGNGDPYITIAPAPVSYNGNYTTLLIFAQ